MTQRPLAIKFELPFHPLSVYLEALFSPLYYSSFSISAATLFHGQSPLQVFEHLGLRRYPPRHSRKSAKLMR